MRWTSRTAGFPLTGPRPLLQRPVPQSRLVQANLVVLWSCALAYRYFSERTCSGQLRVARRLKPTTAWYGDVLLVQFGPFCRVLRHRALPDLQDEGVSW